MAKKKKYLELYRQFSKSGLTDCGLCSVFRDDKIFDLMRPTAEDFATDVVECSICWASGFKKDRSLYSNWYLSPLRANIILFMACLNGEL